QRSTKRLPVLPRPRTIERMKVEQLERESDLRQHITLDAAASADEKWFDARVSFLESPGNRQPRVEVSTRPAPREDHPHRDAGRARKASGSAAGPRKVVSRELPMLTRIPVMTRESTRFERPSEMKGSVRPVVGSKPVATPM